MKDSHIQWTDNTFNPWVGCTKVSPGCLNCYAETLMDKRYGKVSWGAGKPRNRTSPDNWKEPKRWNAAAQKLVESFNLEEPLTGMEGLNRGRPTPPRVFCASLADWLDAEVPIEWLADLLTLIFDCGFLDWQLLTKRPENFKHRVSTASVFMRNHRPPTERQWHFNKWLDDWCYEEKAPYNVWVGTSVEDQLRADVRIPRLLAIPAAVRFLSVEPLLGPIEFSNVTGRADAVEQLGKIALTGVSWVIVGGESGRDARPLELDWVESIVRQSRNAGVAVFVKQLGRNAKKDGVPVVFNHQKGGDPAEWPERFRVAEFPEAVR